MRIILFLLAFHMTSATFAQEQMPVEIIQGELINKLPSFKSLKSNPRFNPPATRNLSGMIFKKTWKDDLTDYGSRASKDPVVQKQTRKKEAMPGSGMDESIRGGSVINGSFDGIPFTNVSPADPTMAVGPQHVVQMINGSQGAYVRVWDKNGQSLVAEKYMYQMANVPSYFGYGDPIVLYDQFANRFFITEFGSDSCANCYSNSLIIGVSQTGDPTGGWFFYKYKPGRFFVDYPKYAAWPDLLFATSNDYNTTGSQYLGTSVYAFEKKKMLIGDPSASMQRTRIISTQYNKYLSLAPVNITGSLAPSDPGNGMFMYFHDDNRTNTNSDTDSIGILTYRANFLNADHSLLAQHDVLAVAAFKSRVCNGQRNCIPSASGGGYDDLSDRFMNKLYYRNFGTHESIVATHTVDANYPQLPVKAGLRWYEIRRQNGAWRIHQQSTYSPDTDGRWMGAININSKGQIALAYNHSGASGYASMYFTGRNEMDSLGVMVYDENVIRRGDGYGTFSNRWGDYNDLVTDPINDSIFWYTAMYASTTWKTRIASFKLEAIPSYDLRLTQINDPIDKLTQCENLLSPILTIRNSGREKIRSFSIGIELDGELIQTVPVTEAIDILQFAKIQLPEISVGPGVHQLKFYSFLPNGQADENTLNDSAVVQFTVLFAQDQPVSESFENETFPPVQWKLENPNPSSISWQRNNNAASHGSASVVMKFFENQQAGDRDILYLPIVKTGNADSLILNFNYAYKLYGPSPSFADSLAIVISPDCGETKTIVWIKGGTELASTNGYTTTGFVPAKNEWANARIDLKPFIGNVSELSVGFMSISKFGQNLYLDSIQLNAVTVKRRDVFVQRVLSPATTICNGMASPVIEIGNGGLDTIRTLGIVYQLNNNPADTIWWSGVLAQGKTEIINNLPSINLVPGKHSFLFYTISPNELSDQVPQNDTARTEAVSFATVTSPISEGFESGRFPPLNWATVLTKNIFSWELMKTASSEKTSSAWVRNYKYNGNGYNDDLYSPIIRTALADSFYISFDIANASRQSRSADTLEVLLTTDCGQSFIPIYKKHGAQLQTLTAGTFPVYPPGDTTGFVPSGPAQWRNELIDITAISNRGIPFQLVFRNSGNGGNNTYLDNIKIYGVNLPARLKENGYILLPNPFDGWFAVRHLQSPINLKAIQVINNTGQVIIENKFNGPAPSYIRFDLGRFANGIYQVKMIYTDKVITERIVKKQ